MVQVYAGVNQKIEETINNTIFELLTVSNCSNLEEFLETGHKINKSKGESVLNYIVYLTKNEELIFGYDIIITLKGGFFINRRPLHSSALREVLRA